MRMPDFPDAACAEVGTDWFYPEGGSSTKLNSYRYARRVCAVCEYQPECAEWGIRHEEHGMWGGLTPNQLGLMRRRRGIVLDRIA